MAAVLWTGSGFVAGVAFWHLVGFWSLVSTAVVADRDGPKSRASIASRDRTTPDLLETGSVVRPNSGCVTLALDRLNSTTRAVPCTTHLFHHGNAGNGGKGDHL